MAPEKIKPIPKINPGELLAEAPLPRVLGNIVDGLLQAQDQLDDHAAGKAAEYARTPAGTLVVPPLWYVFRQVRVDIEMSATFASAGASKGSKNAEGTLLCRLVNPASVSLFGYQASAGLKISLQLETKQELPLKSAADSTQPP